MQPEKVPDLLEADRTVVVGIHANVIAQDARVAVPLVVRAIRVEMSVEHQAPVAATRPGQHRIVHQDADLGTAADLLEHRHLIEQAVVEAAVVIAANEDLPAVEPSDELRGRLLALFMGHVAENVTDVVLVDDGVVILHQNFVHLVFVGKRPTAHRDDARMTEMQVSGEIDHIIPQNNAC